MRCPYCLELTKPKLEKKDNRLVYVCSNGNCKMEIARDFVEKPKIPLATVGMVGFPGHGKTVYVTSLFYLIQILGNIWGNYHCRGLDNHTIKDFYQRIDLFKKGQLPQSTPANFPSPSLFYFSGIPYFTDWFFSFYDTAGEVFEDSQRITQAGRFVAYADVVVLLLNINESGEEWSVTMERLLDTYIKGVYDYLHVDLRKRQNLVVALSKADMLVGKLPDDIETFLRSGTYEWYTNGQNRRRLIDKLHQCSCNVKTWLQQQGCGGFVSKARSNFKSVEYTLISATGAAPVGDQLAALPVPEDPKRVLDPFFWILEKTRPRHWWQRLFQT